MTEPSPEGGARAWLERSWATLEPWLRRHVWWIAAGVLICVGVLAAVIATRPNGEEARQAAPPNAASAGEQAGAKQVVATTAAPATPTSATTAPAAVADAGARRSPTVKVVFKTFPPRRATVMWGGKRLGIIDRGKPVVVERPRDSGPIDVVIRAPGYLPVHARAYTFDDATLEVRITPVDKKDTIYGYQEPIPPDAGAPL
jgi:hypothetical protein